MLAGTTRFNMSDFDIEMDSWMLTLNKVQEEATDADKRLVAIAKVTKMTPQGNIAMMEHKNASLGDDAVEVAKFLRIVPMNASIVLHSR